MRRYTRWYHWLIYIAGGILATWGILVAFWFLADEMAYRAEVKDAWVGACLAFQTQVVHTTERHCQCTYDEVRRLYSINEIYDLTYRAAGNDEQAYNLLSSAFQFAHETCR